MLGGLILHLGIDIWVTLTFDLDLDLDKFHQMHCTEGKWTVPERLLHWHAPVLYSMLGGVILHLWIDIWVTFDLDLDFD